MRSLIVTVLALLLFCTPTEAYYGRNSIEANLSFSAEIDMSWRSGRPTVAELNQPGETRDYAMKRLHKQILFLDGVFHSETFAKKWGGPASCGPWYEPGNYDVKFTGVEAGSARGRVKLGYEFKAKIVVDKNPLRRVEKKPMEVWLPVAPDQIYDLSVKWNKNQCTDREDDVRNSYYYFWDPFMKTCALRKDHPESIQYITATVERLPNTRTTYPEYGELYDKRGKKTLDIAMFWGYIAHQMKSGHPLYRDDSFKAMKAVSQNLRELGFEEVESKPHFKMDKNGNIDERSGVNVLLKMQKLVKRDGRELNVRVTMLLSDSEEHAKDPTFRTFVTAALNQADIFAYDGHSGDGAILDPEKLNLPKPSPEKHQLFFINGCDSYMNYMQKFVTARGGLEKLDLILSGTPTSADAGTANDWAFLEPFVSLKTLTYQSMLDRLEKSSGPDEQTFLVGVVGDENNTWKPSR